MLDPSVTWEHPNYYLDQLWGYVIELCDRNLNDVCAWRYYTLDDVGGVQSLPGVTICADELFNQENPAATSKPHAATNEYWLGAQRTRYKR